MGNWLEHISLCPATQIIEITICPSVECQTNLWLLYVSNYITLLFGCKYCSFTTFTKRMLQFYNFTMFMLQLWDICALLKDGMLVVL
jgi:hypothetical protein